MMDERERRKSRWGRLKTFIGVVTVAFAVTLALVVGNRLSDEALGVLAGAVCGVGAAIPTSLIVVMVSRRRDEPTTQSRTQSLPPQQGPYPPVVVVSPQGWQRRSGDWNGLPPSLTAPMERNFTVVGGGSADMEGGRYGDERYS